MREHYDAIPDAGERYGSVLTRIYHDIGLAAVADSLNLLSADFDPELSGALARGEFYLLPAEAALAKAEMAA